MPRKTKYRRKRFVERADPEWEIFAKEAEQPWMIVALKALREKCQFGATRDEIYNAISHLLSEPLDPADRLNHFFDSHRFLYRVREYGTVRSSGARHGTSRWRLAEIEIDDKVSSNAAGL